MLLTSRTVFVPSLEETDADFSEYGGLSNKCRAAFGEAAVDAGCSDREEDSDTRVAAIDTLANILHYLADTGYDPIAAIRTAISHFENEER